MAIPGGTRLGQYEILDPIGAGGMGEVYRARDTQLHRDVAIKVLPELFAADAERLARFTREAQTLAALNHPNIAHIHGLEGDGSPGKQRALVMELVDGEDLSTVIARGPLPVGEALPIARQIADALEAAHDIGIIHRDLKPANVKVRADGTVKVLDFGLAKAVGSPAAGPFGSDASNGATLTSPAAATGMGFILGTAAYMSPEQARGKPVDRRADIWAFGVVLYEMLVGGRPFEGHTVSDLVASVIKERVPLEHLPPDVPSSVRGLIGRCLEKDAKLRLRDIGEARILLSGPTESGAGPVMDVTPAGRSRQVNRFLVASSLLLALALAASLLWMWRRSVTAMAEVVRFEVLPPDTSAVTLTVRPSLAISPDGSTIAYTASSSMGVALLYVRRRDAVESRPVAGTEEASNPVFSPDGRSVALVAGKKLVRVPLDGQILPLTTVNDPRGLTWLDAGTIVYSTDAAGGLMRISADGGEPTPVTTLNTEKRERSHRWPNALPGGKAVLFTVGTESSPDDYDSSDIEAVTIATGERQVVLRGASMAAYSPSGHLIVTRGGTLFAAPFDADRQQVTGNLVPVVQGVMGDRTTGAVHFSVASNGTLAYVPGTSIGDEHVMVWVDLSAASAPGNARTTVTTSLDLPRAAYNDPAISPDGTRLAFVKGITGTNADVWIYDFGRQSTTRLTFDERNAAPTWSADGRTIYYSSIVSSGSKATIMRKPADGSREAEPVGSIPWRAYLRHLLPDGTALVESTQINGSERSISRIRLTPGKSDPVALEPIVATRADEYSTAVSPDDRWLAYSSDESGRPEVYVRDLSGSGGRWQISTGGGEEPHWSGDGRRLYYRRDEGLYAVTTETKNGFSAAVPQLVFRGAYSLRTDTGLTYDVDRKTGRLLMIRPVIDEKARTSVRVVLNWFVELKSKLAR